MHIDEIDTYITQVFLRRDDTGYIAVLISVIAVTGIVITEYL